MNFVVISPRGSDPDYHAKLGIIERFALRHEYSVHYGQYDARADQYDMAQTVERIKSADFAIADVSYERPSCYFEVGYAQALGKPVYVLALKGTPIHQLLDRGAVEYFANLEDYSRLIERILDGVGEQPLSFNPSFYALKEGEMPPVTAEQLAQMFHETYEYLALTFGYETREAISIPWSKVPERNKRLMIAVCNEIMKHLY